ncbi:MAG TPA: hypothetical protein EYG52_18250 [Pseudomonadales bacterium]|nr:hypothetical protein [Pseudomonadales bacterium]
MMHQNEIPIGLELVQKLLRDQFPQFSGLPLSQLAASASTNLQFRLGDSLLIRMPRQPGGTLSIDKEYRWTKPIGDLLPVAVPEFIALGEPAFGYSERWAILEWLDGEMPKVYDAKDAITTERSQLALKLAEIISALREIDLPAATIQDSQLQTYRGDCLIDYDKQMQRNIEHCKSIKDLELDYDAVRDIWAHAMEVPGSRQVFRQQLDIGDAEWMRGRAWALAIALMTFPYYWDTMPGRIKSRLALAQSVITDITS